MSTSEVRRLHDKAKTSKARVIFLVFMALLMAIVISVSVGYGSPGFIEATQVILSRIFPFLEINPGSKAIRIILYIRLPRIVLAIIAGAGLAASGTTMQGALRNPLVSPYTLGISWAAGFGAALAMALGIGVIVHSGEYIVVANAFIFSLLAMLMVYGIARLRGITPETVILTGIAVSYLFLALLSLVQYVAPESTAVHGIVSWLLGRLLDARWESVLIVLPIVSVAIILMIRHSWDMNVMSLGEETAMSLGVNPRRVLATCMVLGSLATASIISFIGVIGFIGLVSPHIARMLVGSDHRFLFPCSIALGACLLLYSDTLARLVQIPSEIPVGIVTFLIGVPFFLYLMLSKRSPLWH